MISAAALVAMVAGCSQFKETHYLRSVDANGNPVNYYRVRVKGNTGLSSSRFLSGYFDETAVDTYFGEYVQPEHARFPTTRPAAETASGEAGLRAGNESLEGRSLLFLLSSNSDDVATGIQSLAQSETVTATLTRMLGRDRLKASGDAAASLARATSQGKDVAALGDTLVTGLADDAPQADVQANMLRFVNRVAAYLDRGAPTLTTLDAAQQWLVENESRLTAERK